MGARLWRLLLLALLSACAATHAADGLPGPGKRFSPDGRVALFEPDIALSEHVGGTTRPRPEWNATARLLYAQAALETLARNGIDTVADNALPLGGEHNDGLRLHLQAVAEVLLQRHRSRATAPVLLQADDAVGLRHRTDADYGLITWIRDSQASQGRATMRIASKLLIGTAGGSEPAGVTMLVELRTGRVAWYALLPGQTHDLRNLTGARDAAARLLKNLRGGRPVPIATP